MEQPIGEAKIKKMPNQLKNNDLCPICEIGRLKEQVKDGVVNICGKMIEVIDMKSFMCNVCKDGFFDNETTNKLNELVILHRNKQ